MKSVTIAEACEKLSELMDAALRGEEVVITKGERTSIKLIPNTTAKPRPKFGSAKGLIKMSDDFERGSVLNSFQHTQVSLDEPLEDFKDYM